MLKIFFKTVVGLGLAAMLLTIAIDIYLNAVDLETYAKCITFVIIACAWKTGHLIKLVSDDE